ncbi:hypothetical protein NGM36_14615 [Streptomyces mutabilis]|nr:hypothetical protein [Streptomyces mutabilis]MCZ9351005.1 hypothetical protein [Streptomyces mutabilis]MCZ9351006.1 hypothetical protein [Streptomyces mutabilis]MCZ9351018.1 hypothetical protein [Streptomyces mutabilis]
MTDNGPQDTDGGNGVDAGGQRLPPPGDPAGVLGKQSLVALRAPAVRRLLALRARGGLSRQHVRQAGECLGASERTVWRWLAEASQSPAAVQGVCEQSERIDHGRLARVVLSDQHRHFWPQRDLCPLARSKSLYQHLGYVHRSPPLACHLEQQ